jgi:hypothetical protein
MSINWPGDRRSGSSHAGLQEAMETGADLASRVITADALCSVALHAPRQTAAQASRRVRRCKTQKALCNNRRGALRCCDQ